MAFNQSSMLLTMLNLCLIVTTVAKYRPEQEYGENVKSSVTARYITTLIGATSSISIDMSNRNHEHTVSHRAKFAAVRGVPMLSVLPVLTYLVKDINDNAASARQCDPSNHPKVKQDPHVVSRQSNSVELRLAKFEETILKLLPMAQAFEAWLRANNQISTPGLPCVVCSYKDHVVSDFLASFTSFRIDPDSTTSNIQSPISRSPPVEDRPSTSTSYRASKDLRRPDGIGYPSRELADELVATYFASIHHTFPILHQQTFVDQYMKAMEQKAKGKPSREHGFLSSLFAVFACGACLIEKGRPKSGQGEGNEFRGFNFYEKAQLLFWMGTGSSQIEHVQCLSIMAICNATWNTLAQSWINVGGTVRRAQNLGLHLSGRHRPLTHFEREYRRRVWWCVYGLDRVLSISLGRPSGTHEDDYDVELPSELNDAQLAALRDGTFPSNSVPSYMIGFVALLRIYVIAGKILRFVQSAKVEDAKSEKMHESVMDPDSELDNYNLPPEVKYAANDTSNPKMFTLCLIAHFVYNSAKVNLHRPFIPDRLTSSSDHSSWTQCLAAARSCIRIGEITQEMLPASHHLAFAVQYITRLCRSAGVKRKSSEDPGPIASSSRQRLDDRGWTSAGYDTSLDRNTDEEWYEQQQFSNLMRTSSIRTPMSNDISLPPTPSDTMPGHALSNFRGDPALTPNSGKQARTSFEQLVKSQGYTELPTQISLDLNAWSTGRNHSIDEYSGYDFQIARGVLKIFSRDPDR
ncbi:fungal-specific transcription factor domain-containing protein [Lentinula edodes]|uniref:Fungal-specific transcription factor domain-containing protein n=1 Tax=Lentinula lateritia TaxID=40482 RepID=A0A9W9DEP5_9AGAR|nr:fungal-specific transcription factor domain-containing protein [Lentinula edodes]